jgi:hypothetical protein
VLALALLGGGCGSSGSTNVGPAGAGAGGSSPVGGSSSGGAGAPTAASGGGTGGASGSSGAAPEGGSAGINGGGALAGTAGADVGGSGGAVNGGSAGAIGVGGSSEGQTVIKVTTLAPQGPGSLAEALAATGPRLVVFEVGGVIDLNRARLDITQPFVKIAGQTAPSPGITLIRGGMRVRTHDVVIQHVRFRMGSAGAAMGEGFEPDVATDGPDAHDVIFDHVSVAWGVDENLSVSGPRMNGVEGTSRSVTIQNSIIAEGLRNSVHEKGAHSMGTLVHDYCTDVLIANNLYAHNDERNPWYKGYATGAIVNNVIYNPGKWAIRLGPVDGEWTGVVPEGPRLSIVGNYMKSGVDTMAGLPMIGTNSRGSAFMEDNIAVDASDAARPIVAPAITVLAEKPAWRDGLVARPASSVRDHVLGNAGARPKDRDAVDVRIVSEVKAGSGEIRDSEADVGGYPMPTATQRALTVPTSNLDAWLSTFTAEVQ